MQLVRIVGLGGRRAVIEACEQHDFTASPALFLVDGDLHFLRGDEAPLPAGVVRLPAYCIENFLVCPEAFVELLHSCSAVESRESLESRLNWELWCSQNVRPLVDLFVVYALAQQAPDSVSSVGYSVHKLCDKHGVLSDAALQQRINECLEVLCEVPEAERESFTESWTVRALSLPRPLDVVSGKDYLLPIMRRRLNSIVHIPFREGSFRLQLAKHCNVAPLSPLACALREAARGKTPDAMLCPLDHSA